MKQLIKTAVVALFGGFVALGTYVTFFEGGNLPNQVEPKTEFKLTNYTSSPSMPLESIDFVEASNRSLDAVVHVKTVSVAQQYYNPWSRYFGGDPYSSKQQRSSGSGVIISDDGFIVTNNHVIENAETIEITTNDNRTFEATLVGRDPGTDIALLKIKADGMPSITLGDSDALQIGEWVLAVGNPFNLTSTVTAGIVSAKARNINILDYDPNSETFPLESFIQTDAAVNPGNSGGALVNGRGELIGINTAIASRTGSYSGYSFAVPVSIVKKVTADLLEFGKVQRAYIGVSISNIDPELMMNQGLEVSEGAYVRGLLEGGAAEQAGISEGDIIVSVEDFPVKSVTELQEQVGKYRPGDRISVSILRENQKRSLEVLLRDRYGKTELKKRTEEELNMIFGAKFEELSSEEKSSLKVVNGVRITDIEEGKFRKAGVEKGFVITHIDKQPVDSPEDVKRILHSKSGGVLVEGFHQNGMPDYYGFGI
ncbi:Do family serine endopeptidase [Cryomorphaceae bacterium 1068]|nr:Do family serine endopeptidase [Cryomorphaceae bacterium 1068]